MIGGGILRKLAGYLITGGTAALVDLGGFVLLSRMGIPIVSAAALSFVVAAGVNFLLSARFVFGVDIGWSRFWLFLLMATAGFLVNVSVTALSALFLSVDPAIAKLGGIAIAFSFNFAVNLIWVFKGPSGDARKSDDHQIEHHVA